MAILEKIDRGMPAPRIPDRMGRFFRQYRAGRARLKEVLSGSGVELRADGAVSGRALGIAELDPLLPPEAGVLGFPLGEVADTIAISEEIGGLTNVTLWLKGANASSVYNIFRGHSGVRLSGDYRWRPPCRVTPGEADPEATEPSVEWHSARCLKAVAEDLGRPPHALEYVLDYRLGPPGLKFFRCVCAMHQERRWQILPALGKSRHLEICSVVRGALSGLNGANLATLLIYREPWSNTWTIAKGSGINAESALSHSVAWIDFQWELEGSEFDASIIEAIQDSLHDCSIRPPDFGRASLSRRLLPIPRDVLRWLRGCG